MNKLTEKQKEFLEDIKSWITTLEQTNDINSPTISIDNKERSRQIAEKYLGKEYFFPEKLNALFESLKLMTKSIDIYEKLDKETLRNKEP